MERITANFSGVRVLVVDDYPVNQELVKEMLEMMQCEVELAMSGEECLELLRTHRYDIVFLDVQMPELSGYDVAQMIRQQELEGAHIPIVAITADAMVGDREKCLTAGMDDYISKPIRAKNLEQMITRYVVTA